ncbi:MAG: NAD(+)/NADH kinase [Kiritimatiellae bacterium]|jgi:NAD+ kinase|nr:NAD(+)/NADH kinase [Kiritimatiellia bacterium]MDD4341123.1 NAD(+)/NADH kinase [Kiritimatiellia bacterium]
MNIGIFANLDKPAAAATLADLATSASDLGVKLVVCNAETARLTPGAKQVAPARFGKAIDWLLSLGGDGTVLKSVRLLNGASAPILGINLGNLGFLTNVPDTHAVEALRAIASGACETIAYPLIEARVLRGPHRKCLVRARALNDVVLGWGTSPRATMIELEINRHPVASFVCDGLIVATPIGSTGHALSAGGPILHRETQALVIEPICPHTLSNRPVVIPNDHRIVLRVADRRKKLLLSVDGHSQGWMGHGDVLEIRKAAQGVRFIHLPGASWFKLLTQKLHWRGSSAEPK